MRTHKFLLTILLIIMLSGVPIPTTTSETTHTIKPDVTEITTDDSIDEYSWIWEELLDSDLNGSITGDDSVYWGRSLGPYYNSSETLNRLKSLDTMFDIATYFEIGESYENKTLAGIRIQAPFDDQLETRYDSVLVGNHHAREAITVIDSLLFAERVVHDYQLDKQWATKLLNSTNLFIIPVLNPDGLDYLYKFPWQRRNMQPIDGDGDGVTIDDREAQDINGDYFVANTENGFEGIDSSDNDTRVGEDLPGGIDLNRNYGYQFNGSGSSPHPNSMVYRGEFPFEAPETSAFRDFAVENKFLMSMSLHSGIQAIISPWGFTDNAPPDDALFDKITEGLRNQSDFPTWEEIGGYQVNGEWGDWMYGELGSLAYTIETYGDFSSYQYITDTSYGGVWDAFNPDANLVYNTSMQGVQQHLPYYFSVPTFDYYDPEYDIINFVADRKDKQLSLEIESYTDNSAIELNVQTLDKSSMTWKTQYTVQNLSINPLIQEEISIDSSIPDNHIRVYIGERSEGYSYYMNFDSGQIGDSNFSTSDQDTDQTSSSNVEFWVVIPLAMLVLFARKQRYNF